MSVSSVTPALAAKQICTHDEALLLQYLAQRFQCESVIHIGTPLTRELAMPQHCMTGHDLASRSPERWRSALVSCQVDEPDAGLPDVMKPWVDGTGVTVVWITQSEVLPFISKLEAQGYCVPFAGWMSVRDLDAGHNRKACLVHGASWAQAKIRRTGKFKVVAFVTTYNEADIIHHTLQHLVNVGVDVYVIDNWSTDTTWSIAESWLGRGVMGIERFPAEGPGDRFELHPLLKRIADLASTLDADWFIHHDADEYRQSPWPDLNLKDALNYVDELGFNAIDHTVLNFHPVSDDYAEGTGFVSHFRYCEFGNRPGHFLQIKAWKKQPDISLAESGGHEVQFAGRKLFPYKFLLRHYPVRSQSHGLRKVLQERLARFSPSERMDRNWHTHYDDITQTHQFVRKPDALLDFHDPAFALRYEMSMVTGIDIGLEKVPLSQPRLTWTKRIKACFGSSLLRLFGNKKHDV